MIDKNYIKMCEMAEELQRAWRPKDLDTFCYTKSREIGEALIDNREHTRKEYNENLKHQFWLPTLEQLFEMVGDYKAQISRVFLSIMIMKKYKFGSIQELVINAVMEIKYKIYWTGEKWEAIT